MDEQREANIERAIAELRAVVEQRFDGIDQRLDGIDQRLEAHDRRFEGIDDRFDRMQAAIDKEAQLKAMIESVSGDIRMVAEAHVVLEKRVTAVEHRQR